MAATLYPCRADGLGQVRDQKVDVVCPGFAADCLETLEEIAIDNRRTFLAAGGEHYRYLPALNDGPDHITALVRLIERHTADWPGSVLITTQRRWP